MCPDVKLFSLRNLKQPRGVATQGKESVVTTRRKQKRMYIYIFFTGKFPYFFAVLAGPDACFTVPTTGRHELSVRTKCS